ncbi:M4 family metallopeptidase [Pseudoalteromonas carrageenovora]|uniref:M4 family metallopeptidase n=1 Tax=Pseudoalteromonas carrageenovora TaxID=227 RepID=UPI0026E43B0C|nr:M4 family metallopeptidase [Pseudoalteromonas carrageenovora]MDO6546317.1 M4 family metallopeptidase [Pseudoalteromonas carrageenovora]MDO6830856.1 M4 family metallopeptidase [Pseudoalteromonas carrageenovora]
MYKTLSSGLIAFCFINSLSSHAAVSQRVNKSSASEINSLLNHNVALASKASAGSYFIEVESSGSVSAKQTSLSKKMQQHFAGVPIWGQQITVQSSNQHISGFFAKNISLKSLNNTANSQFDEYSAVNALLIKAKLVDSTSYKVINNQRYIYIDNGAAHFVRLIELDVTENGVEKKPIGLVSESDYRVFKLWNNIHSAHGTGPGGNTKTGQYEYGTDTEALDITQRDGMCFLENDKVKTVTMESGFEPSEAYSFACDRNTHKEVNGAFSPLNDAHAFGTAVFDMYQQWYNTAPLTFQLLMRVHSGNNWENATWNGQAMTFGDGADNFYPLVSLDIVSHEVSHGFTSQNSNLIYSDQSGGINESFSDMAGETAEYFLRGETDWLSGADISKIDPALRYFETPSLDGLSIDRASDYYSGMDVHFSSGVFNRAFFLLSNTTGWDPKKAFEIMLFANQNYWVNSSDFIDGACGAINSAIDLRYSANDVISAFNEVGVTCDNIQFIDADTDLMDDNWELLYGLDPSDAADAALDLDQDGLTNLEEYTANTLPNSADTDSDDLSDYDEINVYLTEPNNADSDSDRMPDGWEVSFSLNPLNADDAQLDLDSDTWSNVIEFFGNSDPSDASSEPVVFPETTFDFDDAAVPDLLISSNLQTPWVTTQINEDSGFVLTNNDITDNQSTSVEFSFLNSEQGYVNFNYALDTEVGYDYFTVYINGSVVLDESGVSEWKSASFPVAAGLNTVKFKYSKDVSVSTPADAVYIDNLYIGPNFPDADNNGMSDSWELLYNLDMTNSEDASLDADNDGLSNLLEFLNAGLPNNSDTDGDTIPDGWEYNNSLDLTNSSDASEDADSDGFSNLTEYLANTDPQSNTSFPVALNLTTSFEGSALPSWMVETEGSSAPWFITDGFSTDGVQSIRSGIINDSQFSGFTVTGLFEESVLAFDYKIESESCCDFLTITIDGQPVFDRAERGNSNISEVTSILLNISEGLHNIEFKYYKDGYASSGADTVWLDNFALFSQSDLTDTDNDQLPDYWELVNGLNRLDASDAASDADTDGLTAFEEFNLGTNPNSADSDGDELSDGYEVSNDLLPLDAADANLDYDADGYTNIQEFYSQSLANDAMSLVQTFSQLNESFEDGLLPTKFTEIAINAWAWQANTDWFTEGNASLSSQLTPVSNVGGFAIAGLFEAGFINLDYWVNNTDALQITLNGSPVEISNSIQARLLLPVDDGFNIIKVKYESLYLQQQPLSVDNITWSADIDLTSDFDSDGIPDYWEAEYGLNALEPYDANYDADYDGLTNLQEYQLSGNPLSTDSDGDGIEDSEDSHPGDASRGENSPPEFVSSLEPITVEATSQYTNITRLYTPLATDNGHLEPQVYTSSGSYFPLGEHQITWIARDNVGNETAAIQTVTLVDTTPPVLQQYRFEVFGNTLVAIQDAIIDSRVVFDDVSEIALIEIEDSFVFRTGNVPIPVSAVDGAGNRVSGEVTAMIYPEVSLQPITHVYQNGNVLVDIFISGPNPYDYTGFSLKANNSTQYIRAEQHGPIKVELAREFLANATNISVIPNRNAFIGKNDNSQLVFLSEAAQAQFITDFYQNGKAVNKTIQRSLPDFNATIKLVNLPSTGSDVSLELIGPTGVDFYIYKTADSQWDVSFNANLSEQTNNIDLTLRVKQGDELLATKQTSLRIVDSVIFDDPELDTDGDGIPDIEEGVGDSDKDGIADYLDSTSTTNTAILASGDSAHSIDEFNHLAVGSIKEALAAGYIADMSISEQALSTYFPDLDIIEPHFQAKSDVINLHVTLSNSSSTAEIALPEHVNSILSSDMQVRLLTASGWQSAPILSGNVYEQACSRCFSFAITDGSSFDLDGEVNGVIEIVAKLAQESLNQAPVLNVDMPATIEELATIELDASASTDPDGDTLSYEWRVDHPQLSIAAEDTQGKAVLSVGEFEQTVDANVTLVISDGYEQFTEVFTVTFLHVNQLPSVELSTSSVSVEEAKQVTVTASASDKESSELTFKWVQTMGIEVAIDDVDSNTLKFTAPSVSQTTELGFKLVVSDGEGETEQSLTVTVTNVASTASSSREDSSGGGGSLAFILLLLTCAVAYRRALIFK